VYSLCKTHKIWDYATLVDAQLASYDNENRLFWPNRGPLWETGLILWKNGNTSLNLETL